MSMLQCVLTTLGTLAALYAIKRIHQYIWVDRVPREDLESVETWKARVEEDAEKQRTEKWKAREEAEKATDALETQTERVFQVRKWLSADCTKLAKFDSIMGGGPKI